MLIIYFILIVLFILVLRYKKNNYLAFVVFSIAWVLFAYNYDNADYENYVARFDAVFSSLGGGTQTIAEPGVALVMRWFCFLGVENYEQFKFWIAMISLGLFLFYGIKHVKYVATWAFIYLVCYSTLDVTQFRSFIAFSFVLPCIPLLQQKGLIPKAVYVMVTLFASSIHFSMLFFLVLPLLFIKNTTVKLSLILLAIVIVYTLRGFIINSSYFAKVENYSRSSVLGAIVTSSIIVGNYFMMVFIRWKYKKININNPNKTVAVIASDFEIGRKVALAMLLFIPFVFINSMPLRILRFMSLVEIGYLLNYAAILPKRDSRIILALCFLIGLFMFIWVASPALEGLTQNYILDFFL